MAPRKLLCALAVILTFLTVNCKFVDLKINMGGEAIDGFAAEEEVIDLQDSPAMAKNRFHGSITNGANFENVFKTQRFSRSEDLFLNFSIPDGVYTVGLLFAETWKDAFGPGKRVFDVYLGSKPGGVVKVLDQFDPFRAGGPGGAITRKFESIATHEGLIIALRPIVQNPQIAGVTITGYSYSEPLMEDLPTVAGHAPPNDFNILNGIGPRTPADPSLLYDPAQNPKFKKNASGASNAMAPAAPLAGPGSPAPPAGPGSPAPPAGLGSPAPPAGPSHPTFTVATEQPSAPMGQPPSAPAGMPASPYGVSAPPPAAPGAQPNGPATAASSTQGYGPGTYGAQTQYGVAGYSAHQAVYRRRLSSFPEPEGSASDFGPPPVNAQPAYPVEQAYSNAEAPMQMNSQQNLPTQDRGMTGLSYSGYPAGDSPQAPPLSNGMGNSPQGNPAQMSGATAMQPYSAPNGNAPAAESNLPPAGMPSSSDMSAPISPQSDPASQPPLPDQSGMSPGMQESIPQEQPPSQDSMAQTQPGGGLQADMNSPQAQSNMQPMSEGGMPPSTDGSLPVAQSDPTQSGLSGDVAHREAQAQSEQIRRGDSSALSANSAVDTSSRPASGTDRPGWNSQPGSSPESVPDLPPSARNAPSSPTMQDSSLPAPVSRTNEQSNGLSRADRPAADSPASSGGEMETGAGNRMEFSASPSASMSSSGFPQDGANSFGSSTGMQQQGVGNTGGSPNAESMASRRGFSNEATAVRMSGRNSFDGAVNSGTGAGTIGRHHVRMQHVERAVTDGSIGGQSGFGRGWKGRRGVVAERSLDVGIKAAISDDVEQGSGQGGMQQVPGPGIHNGNIELDGVCLENSTHCSCGRVMTDAGNPEECLFVKNEATSNMMCDRKACTDKLVCACAPGANMMCKRSLVRTILVAVGIPSGSNGDVVYCKREVIEHGVNVLTQIR